MPENKTVPTMTLAEANAFLTQPGGRFEMGEAIIDGRPQRVFTKLPATLRDLFDNAARFNDREYLIHEDERVTYAAFRKAAIALALRLQADGVQPGDRVAIIMRNAANDRIHRNARDPHSGHK